MHSSLTMEPLAYRLLELRKAHGLTQDQLAVRIKATRQQLIDWEKGRHVPKPERRAQIEAFYGLGPGELDPKPSENEEILLLQQVLVLVDELLKLHMRRASPPGDSGAGPGARAAREPMSPQS